MSFIGSSRRVAQLHPADRFLAMFGHQVTPPSSISHLPSAMYLFRPRSPARRHLPILSRHILERDPVQVRLGDQIGSLPVDEGAELELASDALGGSHLLVWSPSPKRLLLVDRADLTEAD